MKCAKFIIALTTAAEQVNKTSFAHNIYYITHNRRRLKSFEQNNGNGNVHPR